MSDNNSDHDCSDWEVPKLPKVYTQPEVDAEIAAAYQAAANVPFRCFSPTASGDYVSTRAILALTPADARVALDRMIADVRLEEQAKCAVRMANSLDRIEAEAREQGRAETYARERKLADIEIDMELDAARQEGAEREREGLNAMLDSVPRGTAIAVPDRWPIAAYRTGWERALVEVRARIHARGRKGET